MANINYEEICQLALDFRNRCFLNAYEAIDCEKLLLQLNVLTLFRPLSTSFSGMCEKKKDKRFILINSNQVLSRQHFTIAHELYHLFVQKEFKIHICNPGSTNTKDIEEKKADTFASNLLMPELGIKRLIPLSELKEGIKLSTLFKLEKYFSVSHTALLYRLKDLKLLTKDEVERYSKAPVIKYAQLYGFDTKLYEIAGNEKVIIGDYAILAKEKFDRNKISESHYIELLSEIGIQLPDIVNEKN
ncbi:MAG: ImmA/IrrE family metallo-endopeptidase [Dysgonamonadaceae bacterium]|jgi:Zn-dependent peptidase ImmA (M78 family)|nr:ImmA/IrrE family metallo-endopeptidase [Dysgonamonadaceae bacterium]